LDVMGVDGVENPIKAKDRVQYHGEVVDPYSTETQNISKKRIFRVRVEQTPVHEKIPNGTEYGV
jgi:hypothetical protein